LGSKQESLNKRIRETISSLSDDDLVNMQRASPRNYTPFARQVLEEELTRRRRMKAGMKDSPGVSAADPDPVTLREVPRRIRHADCYIEVWSDKNFEGEHLRIEGPVEYPTLEFASLKWGDCISSVRVGPSAFVLVYADKEFKGTMMTFGPGQEVSNLEELNFNDEIDSIRLVNSVKVFDGFRAEDAAKPAGGQTRENKRTRIRRKGRGG